MAEVTLTHLTPQELADRWHLAKNTLEHWRVRGDGPPFIRFGKRRVLYPLSEIERFEREHLMATVHIPCRAHPATSVLPVPLLPAHGNDL